MKTFKTSKGTELPLMDIKGKDYLQAAPRIFWMKEEHPEWGIETELLNFSDKHAVFKATIRDSSGKILAQATSMETVSGFESYLEKAETCAVSRAAAFCGYGTLMAQELEEQERNNSRVKLAESPNDPRGPRLQAVPDFGSYIIKFGKYAGKRLDEITIHDLDNYCTWLKSSAKPGQDDSAIKAMEAYIATRMPKGANK